MHRRSDRMAGWVASTVLMVVAAIPAYAFKPFTHNLTGYQARDDATDDAPPRKSWPRRS